MRNSSLVEGFRAENVTGLKSAAEAVDVTGTKVKTWRSKVEPKGILRFVEVKPAAKPAGKEWDPLNTAWAW